MLSHLIFIYKVKHRSEAPRLSQRTNERTGDKEDQYNVALEDTNGVG